MAGSGSTRGKKKLSSPAGKPAIRDLQPATCLAQDLASFNEFGTSTQQQLTQARSFDGAPITVPAYLNEFWTARQRQAHSLHEISYRACFKPQLPRFFIERLASPGEIVYDPFMGRGTTLLEAALMGRVPFGCDVNPLSQLLIRPRLNPPRYVDIDSRLHELDLSRTTNIWQDLYVFFHPETLIEITALKEYLVERQRSKKLDHIDEWIWMVALNRLTGHSPGFLSIYTMPPNQAVSIKSQIKINERRRQTPPRRHIREIILKKSRSLLSECDEKTTSLLAGVFGNVKLLTSESSSTPSIPDSSVSLVVTSPPFLNIVQYATDNWLRCWFLGIDAKSVNITVPAKLETWQAAMTAVFRELHRVLKPGGYVAFEVGEVHSGETRLETAVLPCGIAASLTPELILINTQEFTKTANCWGIDNNSKGTNTNRIVLFRKSR